MNLFGNLIPPSVASFFTEEILVAGNCFAANLGIELVSGILDFFGTEDEWQTFLQTSDLDVPQHTKSDRREFGDFQTNHRLALKIVHYLQTSGASPSILIEPTCGKGSFVLAALRSFPTLELIYAIELHQPYIWQAKIEILASYLTNPAFTPPKIQFIQANVFNVDFMAIAANHLQSEILVLGNPPWVTNSELGLLGSANLPAKSPQKGQSGLSSRTGKSNFDIGESIAVVLLEAFHFNHGSFAMLVKEAVVKNILFDQLKRKLQISNIAQLPIDSQQEFGAEVSAALFTCELGKGSSMVCSIQNMDDASQTIHVFGWIKDKFISNLELYESARLLDGLCPFEWRSGIKHDCSKVMEFEKVGPNHYQNGHGASFAVEENLVYGLLKSSDLQSGICKNSRKFTIVTQSKIGESTAHIALQFPKTQHYLTQYVANFEARKSSIYKGMPPFSIFGIGEYSFKPYKVAISALYKRGTFSLILPEETKPMMLDDTCNFIGFDSLEFATYTYILLNAECTQQLLNAITFRNAKRPYTKEILMRIDLGKIATIFPMDGIAPALNALQADLPRPVGMEKWADYVTQISQENIPKA